MPLFDRFRQIGLGRGNEYSAERVLIELVSLIEQSKSNFIASRSLPMKAGRFKLFGAILALGTAITSGAAAQPAPTTQDLDRRMRAMEQNMDTILRLLQSQQGGQAQPSVSVPQVAPQAQPPRVRGGVLNLDVFTRAVSSEAELNAQQWQPARLPDGPSGVPVASTLVTPAAKFGYGDFARQNALARHSNFNGYLGVSWNGVIQVTEDGQQNFVVEIAAIQSEARTCRGVLRINDEIIVDTQYLNQNGWAGENVSQQGGRRMAPGVYAFSLWLVCIRSRLGAESFSGISATVSMAGPRERAPQPVPASRLGVLQ